MKIIFARIYQKILYVLSRLMIIREPLVVKKIEDVKKELKLNNKKNILITTGKTICTKKFYNDIVESLKNDSFNIFFFNNIATDPSIDNVLEAYNKIKNDKIDAIIAIGGGSTIDASKIIACKIRQPNRDIRSLRGLLKVKKHPCYLVAIPTTAGTGSECTVASVVIDSQKNEKYAINDPLLIPKVAVLNPTYLVELPPSLIATTGMDALTHAVEAFIGHSNTKKTKKDALDAMKLIFSNLYIAFKDQSLESLEKMQEASYLAGRAFTKAYVGYVHAVAHSLGAFYHVPHGLANALILPIVLKKYDKSIYKKLKIIERETQINDLITTIIELDKKLQISCDFSSIIKEEDIPLLIKHINKEVYPLYPVPKYFSDKELMEIFQELKERK